MFKRPLIGIIAAKVSDSEQKQILGGILYQAEVLGADTAVFANIYNYDKYSADAEVENKIYDLITSERIDGLILIAESILNPDLQQYIYTRMMHRGVPVVVTSAELPGLCCVNNDVTSDFEDITRHICEMHHFINVDFLTGPESIPTSLMRVEGCRRVLEQYGFRLPEENVIYGDFWTTSGEALAKAYINGSRPLPDVILCANDYMAYGLCDAFLESDIRVPEDVSVIGYEYVGERHCHAPILTTYLRNRRACGQRAAELICSKITGTDPAPISLAGKIICGDSCPCGVDRPCLNHELQSVRRMQHYLQLNFEANFEHQLTVCRNINDYIHVLRDFCYLIRDCTGIYLCLYEDWCSEQSEQEELSLMVCYRVTSPEPCSDEPIFFRRSALMPEPLPGSSSMGHLYFAPLFFAGRELGYFIIQYDKPDSYDKVFGNWMKIAANGLEELRLKNDIRTLLECRSLSEQHDTATGLFNRVGFENEIGLALKETKPKDALLLLLVHSALFTNDTSADGRNISVHLEAQVVECIRKITAGAYSYAAKLDVRLFAIGFVGAYTPEDAELLSDKLTTLILHTPLYSEYGGLETLHCEAVCLPATDVALSDELHCLRNKMQESMQILSAIRRHVNFPDYAALRQSIFQQPRLEWDAQKACRSFHLSYGHFRATYKELFGYSFHQDLIRCRISLAKHLLLTTSLNLQSIAYQCGYEDDKYFLRQFRKLTGMTPNQYRNG